MRVVNSLDDERLITSLKKGGVCIIRTDTIYGIVTSADKKDSVERAYKLKDRDEKKSPIVLIASIEQMFDKPSVEIQKYLQAVWPGKVSVILPSRNAPMWLSRGNGSIAYRLPAEEDLRQLLLKTGPLIAPSANPEGGVPAMSLDEAYEYFGEQVDYYADGGKVDDNTPSKLIRISQDGQIERLR